jgi:glycosyltransferase involved in cell wall biosynthesis
MRILYLNHTAQMSGAERSLLTLLQRLPAEISPTVACPEGPLADTVRGAGLDVELIPGTDASLRLHAWHTTRAVGELGHAAVSVRRLARRVGAQIVHGNSVRAGLVAGAASGLGGPPAIAHFHDRLPDGLLSSLTLRAVAASTAMVYTCSGYVAAQFAPLRRPPQLRVVHNPVDLDRFSPSVMTRAAARARLDLGDSTALLAVVAQITPWKAQDDAVRMVARLKQDHPDIRLLLIGSPKFVSKATRYDNRAFARHLHELVHRLDVDEHVLFLGEREDVPELMRSVDVVLAPSWEEPFGMAVLEAMAMGLPVVATNVGGANEIITHGRDGLLLPPRQPEAWAAEVGRLLAQPELRASIARAARRRVATDLSLHLYVDRIVAGYRDVLASLDGERAP